MLVITGIEHLYPAISKIAQRYKVQRLVLFGARARGSYDEASDICLAVFEQDPAQGELMFSALRAISTPLHINLVNVGEHSIGGLVEDILQEGIILYEAERD